ncbi:MAG: hypothetical protein FWE23_02465 [Chitinivibrionia bacterium]|nr:hypothetical protein [Chitinivibrionia bacterium]
METADVIRLIWVVVFFFSVLILFFIWSKTIVITRTLARTRVLLKKLDTLYDPEEPKGDESKNKK